ncbi:MAG TPA: DUF4912 domain-containing protein [Polyangiaceae bacterium]|nr:DUF4912 domain-containing protein [Polyangiaceae bacterium]
MSTLRASDLDASARSDLIARAEALGIDKADVLTRAELIDEIVKRTVSDPIERRLARGLLGVARDLVARVVERGLHLPDAAALIRGLQQVTLTPVTPPIATVTLAEIYAGQGHRTRALAVLDEVLAKESDHTAARTLRERIAALPAETATAAPPSAPPPLVEPSPAPDHDRAPDRDPAPDRDRDHDHDHDRDRNPDHDPDPDPEGERDTLPPASGALPTLVLADLPPAPWYAEAPDELGTASARTTEIVPTFAWRDADQVILVPVDATSALAHWEVRETAVNDVRARAEGGGLILRIVAVTPSWDGPKAEIRDIEVVLPVGDWWVCDLPAGAVLRAAIGWRADRTFDPLAVALDVSAPGEAETVTNDDAFAQERGDADEHRSSIEARARQLAEQGRPAETRDASSWHALAPAPWEAPFEASSSASIATR